MHATALADNDPLNKVDPLGLRPCEATFRALRGETTPVVSPLGGGQVQVGEISYSFEPCAATFTSGACPPIGRMLAFPMGPLGTGCAEPVSISDGLGHCGLLETAGSAGYRITPMLGPCPGGASYTLVTMMSLCAPDSTTGANTHGVCVGRYHPPSTTRGECPSGYITGVRFFGYGDWVRGVMAMGASDPSESGDLFKGAAASTFLTSWIPWPVGVAGTVGDGLCALGGS